VDARLPVALAVLVVGALSACTTEIQVRPIELPSLAMRPDERLAAPPPGVAYGNVGGHRVAYARGPGGEPVALRNPLDVIVRTKDGREIRFREPVRPTIEGDELVVQRAGEKLETRIPLQDIRSTAVTQTDEGASAAIILTGVFVATLLLSALLTAPTKSTDDTSPDLRHAAGPVFETPTAAPFRKRPSFAP
jgi:hypothetical protein